MRFSHDVKHGFIAFDGSLRFSHYGAMKLTDVTPEWIAATRDKLGRRDVDIYTNIGMTQDAFSKAMNGYRKFKTTELEAIVAYLTEAGTVRHVPFLAELVSQFGDLAEDDQKAVLDLVERLARGRREVSLSADEERPVQTQSKTG